MKGGEGGLTKENIRPVLFPMAYLPLPCTWDGVYLIDNGKSDTMFRVFSRIMRFMIPDSRLFDVLVVVCAMFEMRDFVLFVFVP